MSTEFMNIPMIGRPTINGIVFKLCESIVQGNAGYYLGYYDATKSYEDRVYYGGSKILEVMGPGVTNTFLVESGIGGVIHIAPENSAEYVYFITGEPYLNGVEEYNTRCLNVREHLKDSREMFLRIDDVLTPVYVLEAYGYLEQTPEEVTLPTIHVIDTKGYHIQRCWDSSFDFVIQVTDEEAVMVTETLSRLKAIKKE